MRNFCTLYDSKFLPQGIVLYESLVKHCSDFRYGVDFVLYVLPLDEECSRVMKAMALPGVEVLDLAAFESAMGMAGPKSNRTFPEYCYTAGSNLAAYLLATGISEINYIDSDCLFMSSVETIFDEIGDRSIGIIPHRFAEADKARLEKNGQYNVSLVHFKNTEAGRQCLDNWARLCREWCYYKNEPTRFCDQKYLDYFEEQFGKEVAVIGNIGVGLAPWNLQQYQLTAGPCVDGVPVCMFHAHEFRRNEDGTFRLTNYPIRQCDRDLIYASYVESVTSATGRIAKASIQLQAERA